MVSLQQADSNPIRCCRDSAGEHQLLAVSAQVSNGMVLESAKRDERGSVDSILWIVQAGAF